MSNKDTAPVEMLADGGFEQAQVGAKTWGHSAQVGGWRSDTEIEVWGKNFYGLKATEGDKIAELDFDHGRSNIYQDVSTEAGTEYTFSFDYMKRPDSKAGSDTINVFWNGELVGTVDPSKSDWSRAEFKVTGTGGNDRIEFREDGADNDSYGGLLDNASLKRSGPSAAERAEAAAAETAAADKLAAEKAAAEKAAADKAAAEQHAEENGRSNNDGDKHDGRGHGDGDHNDDGHTDNGRGGEKHDHDDRDHDDRDGHGHRNDDDDKHDGRGHGDGDHNDDGHPDNGHDHDPKGEDTPVDPLPPVEEPVGEDTPVDPLPPVEEPVGEDTPVDPLPPVEEPVGEDTPVDPLPPVEEPVADDDALMLTTADVSDFGTGEVKVGSKIDETINGGAGADQVYGKDGNDIINGDRDALVTIPLEITVGLFDENASERLSIVVSNMPAGASLSAGVDNGDGSWTLTADDLAGLTITGTDQSNFTLKVEARTEGSSNMSAATEINVSLLSGQDDLLVGNKGNDVINGDAGDDLMYGGSMPTGVASTTIPTYADNDVLHGGAGNDTMYGNSGDDQLFGDEDNDTIFGGKGNDLVDGGIGDDVLAGNTGDDMMVGGDGDDVVRGNAGDDIVMDGAGNDIAEGNSGNDVMVAGEGDDSYNGGSGYDTIDFSDAKGGMEVDLSKKVATGMGTDKVWNFEVAIGSTFDDVMKGSKSAETLIGGEGDDVLRGLGGADQLFGGEGQDTFVWMKKDVVDDFGKHLGVDAVLDLGEGDRLDISEMTKGNAKLLNVMDGDNGATIQVNVGGKFVDVATVADWSANDLLASGMILT